MKVAIVGSSVLSERQTTAAEHILEAISRWIDTYYGPVILVSGGAEGVDTLAEEEWNLWGWSTDIKFPKNDRWQPEGYKERNLLIAQECDILYSIRAIDSKTYGSGWTADRAEEMGKQVWRYYV